MDFEKLLPLVIGIIYWVYTNYVKLQKEAVERSRKLASDTGNQPAPPSQPVQPIEVIKPKPVVRKTLLVKAPVKKIKQEVIINEQKVAEDFWNKVLVEEQKEIYINSITPEKANVQLNTESSNDYVNILDEIHTGKADWRKAVIYGEILRPVYF